MKIQDSTIVVTGGASGLGRATAERLSAAGARLVLLDLARQPGADVARALGGETLWTPGDVTSAEDIALCRRVSYEDWKNRGFVSRFLELLAVPIKDQL